MVSMKFNCAQKTLNEHLALAAKAVSTRPSRPIFSHLLVTASEEAQTVNLVGFDEAIAIETCFSAQVERGGAVCLPAKLWGDIVSRLADGAIALEMGGQMDAYFTVTMSIGKSKYDVRGLSSEDYPNLPTVEGNAIAIAAHTLLKGIQGSLVAVSDDESTQVLMGVHLLGGAESLEFAATDGHRLSVVPTDSDTDASGMETTIAGRALKYLEQMLKSHEPTEQVQVWLDDTQVRFDLGGQRLVARLLEGQYPNYRQLLPKEFARQVRVDRRVLLVSLERIAVMAAMKSDIVRLNIEVDRLSISVDATEVGSGVETLAVELLGDAIAIAFNVRYLIDGLKAIDGADVELMMNTPTSPAVLRSARAFAPPEDDEERYLLMPVQIKG